MLNIVHKLYLLLPVLSRHFGHLVGVRPVLFSSSCTPIIFRKRHEAFPFTPSGYEMASKLVALGIFTSLPLALKHVLQSNPYAYK